MKELCCLTNVLKRRERSAHSSGQRLSGGLPAVVLSGVVLSLVCAPSVVLAEKKSGQPVPETQITITIDTAAPSKVYSPFVFGGLIEHFGRQVYGGIFEPGSPLSDENGYRKDVIAALKELKVSVIRWPGGCFASGYNWKNGVGKDRKPVPDPVWGVTDPNTFGTDEFIEWCRLVGCEPYISANANRDPAEMKQWLEYCNSTEGEYAEKRKANGHEKPFNVKFWSIGNENYGFWEIGRYNPETWAAKVKLCADAMRVGNPDIKLVAPVWRPKGEWYGPMMKAAGDDVDYIGVHQYWLKSNAQSPYNKPTGYQERSFLDVIRLLEATGYRGKVKVAFDEWNLRRWHHPQFPRKSPVKSDDQKALDAVAERVYSDLPEPYTMLDAIFNACFLNSCLRHCDDIGMANMAPTVNTRGPLYAHPKGIVKRTSFHTLAMYANDLEERVATLEIVQPGELKKSNELVDAIATVDENGKRWAIALVNRDPFKTVVCTVKLGDRLLDGTFDARMLAGDSPEAFNDIEHPDRVVPEKIKLKFSQGEVALPPHSLTIVEVD